jgi:hypothetical protein
MDWTEYERKRSWPNLKYQSGICLEGLRKIIETLRISSRELNPDPLTAEMLRLVAM